MQDIFLLAGGAVKLSVATRLEHTGRPLREYPSGYMNTTYVYSRQHCSAICRTLDWA